MSVRRRRRRDWIERMNERATENGVNDQIRIALEVDHILLLF